mgnify:CR=1 FL=1
MKFRINRVDNSEPDVIDSLSELHRLTFDSAAPLYDFSDGWWWIASYDDLEVGFAGLSMFQSSKPTGYLCRSAVVEEFRGNGLQRRFIRARERYARKLNLNRIVTDTRGIHSANNLIQCGYRLYRPKHRWAFKGSNYWEKKL